MTEQGVKQTFLDAILDADSLERFINGSDEETVFTRLSATYPTIRNAIKQLFVNGGLPATPFKNKASMESSGLPVDSYAVVTDDPDPVNIGLYINNDSEWVKSNFLEYAFSIGDISTSVSKSIFGGYSKVSYSPIVGYSINTKNPKTQFFNELSPNDERAYIKISVLGFSKMKTSDNSVMPDSNQRVVFVGEQGEIIGIVAPNSDNEVAIPSGAEWAYRSFRINSTIEPNDFEVFLYKEPYILNSITDNVQSAINSDLDKRVFASGEIDVNFEPIRGAVVDTGSDPSKIFATEKGDVRKYISIPAEEYRKLTIHNHGDALNGNWAWYYVDTDNLRRYLAPSNAKELDVPDDAVSIIKSVYLLVNEVVQDDVHFTITATPKNKSIQQQVDDISDKVVDIDSLELKLRNAKDRAAIMQEAFDSGNTISPNSFTGSQNERIHAAVDFARWQGWGIVELSHDTQTDSDVWVVSESIKLPSNCWLYINNVTLKKADGMFDTLIRNDGIVPNASNHKFADVLNENSNIRIFGNDKNLSRLEGNSESPYTAPHPVNGGDPIPWVYDKFGWRCFNILFANTIGYEVYNLHISKTTSWAISNEHGCYGFKYHDIEFQSRVTNGDGIDVRIGCHNFEIYNISGRTTDDMVAINSGVIENRVYPTANGRYLFPLVVGGYLDRGFGLGISNGKIWNISGGTSNEAVLLLTGGGGYLEDISVSDINDDDGAYSVAILRVLNPAVYGLQSSPDDITNITISNITAKYSNKVIELGAPVGKIRVHNVSKTAEGGFSAIEKTPSYTAEQELMTNIYTKG